MLRNRNRKETPDQVQKLNATKGVSNGPAKLCQAFNITKDEFNCKPLNIDTKSDAVIGETVPQTSENLKNEMGPEKADESEVPEDEIVVSTRVGIDGCGKEAAALPLQFYIRNNLFVSVIKKGHS